MKSEFLLAFNEICEQRGLSKDVVLEAIESALVSAFRRNIGVSNLQNITAKIDPLTGTATILAEKEVVESVQDSRTEVAIKSLRKLGLESAVLGETVMVDSTPEDFGRISAQTAKQVILQRIREAERDQLYDDFSGREGEIVNGTVQSVTSQAVTIGLGRTEAILPRSQQVPGERYQTKDRVRAYVLEVKRSSRGPSIIVSRNHRNMLRRMLELEVPEIYNGLVEIKNVAREAGQRSKVAVAALQDGVDPVGACVGLKGVRIQSIVRELHDEKIDVIEWNADPRLFIAKSLSPARVAQVYVHPNSPNGKTATVIVADDQLSLAIGREGQNARLAAKLTGWRIDIKSLTEAAAEALEKLDHPLVAGLIPHGSPLLEQTAIILAKKQAGRPITAEDFNTLNRLVDLVEGRFAEQDEAERRAEETARRAVPVLYYQMPVAMLSLSEPVQNALETHGFESVGNVVALVNHNPDQLRIRARLEADQLAEIKRALETSELPATPEELEQRLADTELRAVEPAKVEEPVSEPQAAAVVTPAAEQPQPVSEEPEQPEQPEMVEEYVTPVALYEEPPPEIQIPVMSAEVRPVEAPLRRESPTAPAKPAAPAKQKPGQVPFKPVIAPARKEEGEDDLFGRRKRDKKRKDRAGGPPARPGPAKPKRAVPDGWDDQD